MTDLERLEHELGPALAALRSYAGEADTSVDSAEMARLISRRYPRRGRLGPLAGALPLTARTVARAFLVTVALLLLLLAALAVGQGLLRGTVHPFPVRGHVDCLEVASGTRSVEGATVVVTGVGLDCRIETENDHASGTLTLVITRTLVDGHNGTQLGTATLTTRAGAWTGTVVGLFVEGGPHNLHMLLEGSGSFRDQRLGLALISPDGVSWGARGTIGPRP